MARACCTQSDNPRSGRRAEGGGRSKSYNVKRTLDEWLADRTDYLLAISALERDERRYSAAEVTRELGVRDTTAKAPWLRLGDACP